MHKILPGKKKKNELPTTPEQTEKVHKHEGGTSCERERSNRWPVKVKQRKKHRDSLPFHRESDSI